MPVSRQSRVSGGRLLPVLAALCLAGCAAAASDGGVATSGVLLQVNDPAVTRIGRLDWLGGLAVAHGSPDFGGISGMLVTPAGHLLAVTDRAHWLEAEVERDAAGRLSGLHGVRLRPLADLAGGALGTDNHRGDAEALARAADGSLLVAFERRHRIWRYADTDARPAPVGTPAGLAKAPFNGGLEAVAALADGRLLLLTEQLREDGDAVGWLGRPGRWQRLSYALDGPYVPADAAAGPDGSVFVLERRFSVIGGFGSRLTRIAPEALAAGGRIVPEELARFEAPYVTENFEALAALPDGDGGTLLYLASDDNFHPLQRTLLLLFRLR